jgi:hypothetical protein
LIEVEMIEERLDDEDEDPLQCDDDVLDLKELEHRASIAGSESYSRATTVSPPNVLPASQVEELDD